MDIDDWWENSTKGIMIVEYYTFNVPTLFITFNIWFGAQTGNLSLVWIGLDRFLVNQNWTS